MLTLIWLGSRHVKKIDNVIHFSNSKPTRHFLNLVSICRYRRIGRCVGFYYRFVFLRCFCGNAESTTRIRQYWYHQFTTERSTKSFLFFGSWQWWCPPQISSICMEKRTEAEIWVRGPRFQPRHTQISASVEPGTKATWPNLTNHSFWDSVAIR